MPVPDMKFFISDSQEYAYVSWTEPQISDNSGLYTVWSSHHPAEVLKEGVTTVTYRAIDSSHNENSISFNITVEGKIGVGSSKILENYIKV